MKRFSTGIFAVLCLASLACGGGGGGGGGSADCATIASDVNACIVSGGGTAEPTIQAQCDSISCTGSLQTALDCVKALTCSSNLNMQANACKDAQGCTFPATCTGVAYWMWNWSDGQIAVSEASTQCNGTTCTGSKATALQCIVALHSTASSGDVNACLGASGCPAIMF